MINLTALNALLEKVIQPFVGEQLSQKTLLYQTAKDGKSFKRLGMSVYVPVRLSRFANISAHPDGDFTVDRGDPKYDQAVFSVKLISGSFEIDKPTLEVPSAQEVVPHLATLTKALTNDLIWELNRQFWGDGSATLGTAAAAGTASTTLTLSPYGGKNGDIRAQDIISAGDYIKIGTNPAVQVVSVSGNTVTIATAQTWASGAVVYKARSNGNVSNDILGMGAIVANNNNYGGLSETTYPNWTAYRDVPATATPLALTDLYKAFTAVRKFSNSKYHLFMNQTLFNKYGSLLQPLVRFSPKEALSGGWTALEFMGGNADVILDYLCPDDSVFFIPADNLYRLEIQPPQFEKGTDGNLFRSYGQLKYEAIITAMLNLGVDVRAAFGVVGNRTA